MTIVPPRQPRYAPKKSISLIEILRCTFPLFARYQQDGSLSSKPNGSAGVLLPAPSNELAKAGLDFGYVIIKTEM
jgi:hypothetical protein